MFIDANDLSLALEQMAPVLSEDEQPLNADGRGDMLALVERMHMGDRVCSGNLERLPLDQASVPVDAGAVSVYRRAGWVSMTATTRRSAITAPYVVDWACCVDDDA